jgi:hypothetical protein
MLHLQHLVLLSREKKSYKYSSPLIGHCAVCELNLPEGAHNKRDPKMLEEMRSARAVPADRYFAGGTPGMSTAGSTGVSGEIHVARPWTQALAVTQSPAGWALGSPSLLWEINIAYRLPVSRRCKLVSSWRKRPAVGRPPRGCGMRHGTCDMRPTTDHTPHTTRHTTTFPAAPAQRTKGPRRHVRPCVWLALGARSAVSS